jgi:hypothetical protein
MNANLAWDEALENQTTFSAVNLGLSLSGAMQVSSSDCLAYQLQAPSTQAKALTVNLFIVSGPGLFYVGNDCAVPLGATLTVPAGASSASFYYKGIGSGAVQFKATASGLGSATYSPTLAIPAPASLAADVTSLTSITLSWSDQSIDESGFAIERSLDGVNFSPLATVPAATVSYLDFGLTTNQPYTYRVRALNAGGASTFATAAFFFSSASVAAFDSMPVTSPSTTSPTA